MIKTGFKFLAIPLLLVLIGGFIGFKSETNNQQGIGILNYIPLSLNGSNRAASQKTVKQLNLFNSYNFAPFVDTTKKAKIDSTKKALADTTKKKILTNTIDLKEIAKTDTTKKTPADTTKKKNQIDAVGQKETIKTDTTKKASAGIVDKKARAKAESQSEIIKMDTIKKALADTTKKKIQTNSTDQKAVVKADTTKRDTISADTQKLIHIEKFSPVIELNQKYKSTLYDPFQNRIQRSVKLDSTGTKVTISETIAGQKVKPDIVMPVEEYLALRSKGWIRDIWERPYRAYEKKESKKDLQKLMSDFTKVDIPLPSVSFLSIFGEPKIQLEVNGSVKVHAGWRNETTEGFTLALQGNSRNEPDFSQEIQIGLNGKIGDKLTIGADWGTKRNFQYENILKIKYTGYDDEIVQSVEAGNVSMQTSPLIGGSEALFGVKAKFQIGPLRLEALASQKRSQSEQKSVTSGSQVTQFSKHAWEYSTNHYFIDSTYATPEIYNAYYKTNPPTTNSSYYVNEIEVWKTTTGLIQQGREKKANAYLDLPPLQPGETRYSDESRRDSTKQSESGRIIGNQRFVKLEKDVDYSFNEWTGVISFKTLINESEGVAVAYKTRSGKNYGEMAATNNDAPILVLKLVKPPNLQPSFTSAWKLQLRNIYALGGKKIKKEGFKLYIKYQVEGVDLQDNINGKKLLNIFGLDKVDAGGNSNPDNEFDFLPEVTIIPETGEVIFPVLQPFNTDLPADLKTTDNKYNYEDLYTNTPTMARIQTSKDKFVITGEYSAASSSTIQIFNAVENSVKVTLDGVELKPGVDFTVEYMGPIAELVIRNPRALVAGANLNINYEQNDMVNLASKTLLGLRGMIDITKETKLGFTALNLNQQTLSDKVTIGQEPLSNSMYGIDFSGTYELPFLTKIMNNIIPTNEVSKLVFNGEFAYINPDPNTKKSTIGSDESKSIAYIDDFEGSRKLIPIGANYGGWKDISFPRLTIDGSDVNDSTKLKYKAKVNWFNDIRTNFNVTVEDLYGKDRADQTSREDQRIIAMDFWYKPRERGYYNRKPDLSDKSKEWGGIMRSLSSTANNLVEENIQYIEFWMKISEAPKGAKLYIDLGQISEDVIPNRRLDTEDKNMNDAYDAGEDTGLDGKGDEDEKNDTSLSSEADPSNDDYDANAPDYSKINGTEGNASNIDLGRLPDSEDLNRNWSLDNLDNFFRYEVPIDTSRLINPFIQGGKGGHDWYLIRIPLNKYSPGLGKGNPDLRIAETIRFFVTGTESDVHLRLAEINLVGNQWRKLAPSASIAPEKDEVLLVQTISIDDNKSYTSPPGLQQEIDRTKTDKTVYKNEQSLNLVINNLDPGDRREIIKDYSRGLDIFNYKEMRMYIHGDDLPISDGVSYFRVNNQGANFDTTYNSQLYFRFGADTTNFYEYRMPIKPGWQDMKILFSDLTALKQSRTRIDTLYQQEVPGRRGHYYGIRGTPSLTAIKFFIVGIYNPKKPDPINGRVSGSVWINELRVLDADASPGWAYMGSASFKLADILLVNFTTQNKNPYFHRLAAQFGNRTEEQSWSLSTEVDLLKFIPFDLPGSSLKFSYTKSEAVNKPLYLFGTDIKVTEAVAQLERQLISQGKTEEEIKGKVDSLNTVSNSNLVTETYSLPNIAIRLPIDNWFNRDVINGLTFGFNYTQLTSKTPTTVSSNSWQWDANARYQLDLSRKGLNVAIADIPILGEAVKWSTDYNAVKIHFFPQSVSVGLSAKRQFRYDLSRSLSTATTTTGATQKIEPSIYRDFTTTRFMELVWMMTENAFFNLTVKYNLDIASSNAYLLADSNVARSEKDIWRDIFSKGLFGKDYAVQQNLEFRTNPRLPSIWDLNKYFQLSFSYAIRYNWKNDFQQKELGKSALYDATFRFGTSLRWKALTAPLFTDIETSTAPINTQQKEGETRRGRGREEREGDLQNDVNKAEQKDIVRDEANLNTVSKDSALNKNPKDSVRVKEKPGTVSQVLLTLKNLVRFAFFDYEKLDFNLELQNSLGGSALKGDGNGFNNFWGFTQNYEKGPSRLFMLGLSNDLGPRAYKNNTSVSDNFAQKSKIEFKTTRPLWEGAEISLIWNVNWGLNKTTQMRVEENGNLIVDYVNATGTIERSFLTIPPVLMFSTIFNNGIKKVNDIYGQNPEANLSDAFIQGFETFPFLSKLPFLKDVMKYIPRPNWSFTWQGLEKLPIFNFAKRVSLTHAYTANYREGWKISAEGTTEIQQQSIDFSFSPLLGLNLSFDGVLGGTLNTSIKYNTKSIYTFSAGSATKNITLGLQNDMDFSASFLKSGFEIPMFGLALKNDIEFSISFTSGRSSNILYKMDAFKDEGEPVDGTIRTKISPRVKYNMSQKVNISVYYERTSVKPEGASRTPPITTNLAGIDVEIRIGN